MTTTRAILACLDRVCGTGTHFPLPERTLLSDVNLELGRRAAQRLALGELQEGLRTLEERAQVVAVRDDAGELNWKITLNGRAALNE